MSFPAPKAEPTHPLVEVIDVVGMTFADNYPASVYQLPEDGVSGLLVRNPKNEYDSNAIEVHAVLKNKTTVMMGHLPAKDGTSGRIAPAMDLGVEYQVTLVPRIDPAHPGQPGLTAKLIRIKG